MGDDRLRPTKQTVGNFSLLRSKITAPASTPPPPMCVTTIRGISSRTVEQSRCGQAITFVFVMPKLNYNMNASGASHQIAACATTTTSTTTTARCISNENDI